MTNLPHHQQQVLREIMAEPGINSRTLGEKLLPYIGTRAASASMSGIAKELIRKGLVERRLIGRELYGYWPIVPAQRS